MGIFNFSSLRDALGGVKGRLSELNKDIANLEQDRAALVALPLPYLDFCGIMEQPPPAADGRFGQNAPVFDEQEHFSWQRATW